ncbi:GDSL esterase/lipase At1g31550-like [Herrania umbratica]|uniref:GDSL esterase/lipase At1g31550-like n=1 Tax=Herrania umbratica TaxID=108875 RepID=A0A6J1AKH5_9ROSI|nr:GDSL esterase/lipase At1g31550-like [Herrania umbratica]
MDSFEIFTLLDNIASAINELIEYGAGTILVPGSVPLGCMGSYLALFQSSDKEKHDPVTGCLTWANEFGEYHNELHQKELDRIPKLHPHVHIIYADYYNTAMRFYTSPNKFGFTETLKSCSGVGGPYGFNSSLRCGDPPLRTCCDDPSSHVSWDGVHYTEAAYRLLSKAILEQLFTIPNINNLCLPFTLPAVSFLFVITIDTSDHVNGCFTSIFSFGDSFTDNGNLVHISLSEYRELPHCAFPPQGRAYFGHPTGRCSDGRLVIDFLAEGLGLPLLPPYFGGENGTLQNFPNGVNLAVSGVTALDFSFFEERGVHNHFTNFSLRDEEWLFKDALPSLCPSFSGYRLFCTYQ